MKKFIRPPKGTLKVISLSPFSFQYHKTPTNKPKMVFNTTHTLFGYENSRQTGEFDLTIAYIILSLRTKNRHGLSDSPCGSPAGP